MPQPDASSLGALVPLLAAIEAGIVVRGPDRRVRHVNRAACELLQVAADDVIATGPEDALPFMMDGQGRPLAGSDNPEEIAFAERRTVGPQLLGVRRPGGRSPAWGRLVVTPIDLDDGVGTVATLQDVTEQEWTARATAAQSEVLADFVHGDAVTLARLIADRVGAIDPSRWALTVLLRRDGTRVVGTSAGVPDLVADLVGEVDLDRLRPTGPDEDPRGLDQGLGPVLAEAGVGRLSIHVDRLDDEPVSWLVLGGSGRPGGAEGLAPHLPSLGRLLRLAVERDRVAGEVEASTRRAQHTARHVAGLLDALPIGVVEVDLDRIVRYVNPAMERMYGFDREDSVGRPTPTVGESRDWYERAWAGLMEGRPLLGHHARRRHRDGSPIDVRISYVPSFDDDGNVTGAVGIHEDVTERTRLEEQLRQSQKMEAIGQLAGGVAHDFNNLLTVIGGNLELALTLVEPDAPSLPFLEQIRDAAARATSVASQLLAVARPRVDRVERFEACELVAELEGLLARMIGASTPLSVAPCDGDCWVEGDRSQLEQVMLNLVLNARDASPDGATIELRTGSSEVEGQRWVRLEVEDEGSGMDASTRERAFEPFFTTKDRTRGTGLGLATSYGIVTQWGGSITIDSEPGDGTTVRVDLPGVVPPDAALLARTAEPAAERDGRGLTVLLVEDEAALRELIERALVEANFTVAAGGTLDDARAVLPAATRPDILVTDVVLVGERGPEVADRLHEEDPDLPVLYISGYAGGDDGRRALPPGAALLPKPFRVAELVSRILQLVPEDGTTFERSAPRTKQRLQAPGHERDDDRPEHRPAEPVAREVDVEHAGQGDHEGQHQGVDDDEEQPEGEHDQRQRQQGEDRFHEHVQDPHQQGQTEQRER